jgi:hypothetical protein
MVQRLGPQHLRLRCISKLTASQWTAIPLQIKSNLRISSSQTSQSWREGKVTTHGTKRKG